MPKLIDMIRSVPETAVRLWCGGTAKSIGDVIQIDYEGRTVKVQPEVFFQAQEVVRILRIRPRMLRLVQDVLELRHDAENIFMEILFGRTQVPKVLFIPAGVTASGYYRAMIPSDIMFEAGKTIAHFTANVDMAKVLQYDVLWVQLLAAPLLIELVKKAKESGIKIVYDIDDRLDAIPPENQAITVYGTPEMQANIKTMIELADVVTVSTKPLSESPLLKTAKKVHVLPNMLTANVLPRKHPSNPAFVRILWAGSPTHKRDLAIVAPAVRNVLKRHKGKVRFTCFGERLPEELSDCYDYIDLQEPVDFESFHDKIASISADFGIAPLENNPFNDSKSAIKSLEYAAAGYPMLLSPVGEYPEVVAAGLPAELVADDGWEFALERMIATPRQKLDETGKACQAWVCANRCVGTTKAEAWSNVVIDLVQPSKKVEEKVSV